MLQFLADECVFASTVCLMRELGLKVHRVQELGLRGAKEREIFLGSSLFCVGNVGALSFE